MKSMWMTNHINSQKYYILEIMAWLKYFDNLLVGWGGLLLLQKAITAFSLINQKINITKPVLSQNSWARGFVGHATGVSRNALRDGRNYTSFLSKSTVTNTKWLSPETRTFKFTLIQTLVNFNLNEAAGFGSNGILRSGFIDCINGAVLLTNAKNFVKRWNDYFNLSFNLSYYQTYTLFLGSSVFKKEISAINWSFKIFDLHFWRFSNTFFVHRMNRYNNALTHVLWKAHMEGVSYACITDCLYHSRTINIIRRCKIYTIGLVGVNLTPWIVDYPVLSFYDGFSAQAMFIKSYIFSQRRAKFELYKMFRLHWLNLLRSRYVLK